MEINENQYQQSTNAAKKHKNQKNSLKINEYQYQQRDCPSIHWAVTNKQKYKPGM